MPDNITDIELSGPGPFAIPQLESFVSLLKSDHPSVAILQCRFEDGTKIHLPITSRAAEQMTQALQHWIALIAEAEAKDKTKH